MGIQLYREGHTHCCFGVTCEMIVIDNGLEGLLDAGWVMDVKDLNKQEEEDNAEIAIFETEESKTEDQNEEEAETEEEGDGLLTEKTEEEKQSELKELRSRSREAGLKNVGNKSADTLKKELSRLEEG